MSDYDSETRKRKIKQISETSSNDDSYGNHGRWTAEEHEMFLEAINQFGREWDKVQAVVKTRSLAQVRSHAQKYFLKLSKNEEMEKLSEYEFWNINRESNNVVMVLELMGSILKKLKVKREELLAQSGESRTGTNSSDCSHCEKSYDLESHHENDKFGDLQKAIEQLDAKTYNDVTQETEEIHHETETDQEERE